MAMCEYVHFRPAAYGVNFTGKGPLFDIDRRQLYDLFERYGQVTKLYISPDGTFGAVYFSSCSAVKETLQKANRVPPFYLKLSPVGDGGGSGKREIRNRSCNRSKSSSLNGSVSSDMDDVIDVGKTVMYDVYGNPIEVFEDDDGGQYVPYHQISKAGYKLYTKHEIEKQLHSNDRLLNEFNVYMLTKARKFMRDNDLIFKDTTIEETINRCRQRIFTNGDKKKPNNNNNLKFTIKQNKPEQQSKTSRHSNQIVDNVNQNSFDGGETTKKTHIVTLKEDCFQKVLVNHVDSASTCYVTPFENIEFKNRLMQKVTACVKTGKKAELYKNLIYACNYDNAWYRAKIIRKDSEIEAFFIDDGRKAIIKSGNTLPKDILDQPAQAVFIQIDNADVKLEKGITLEVKPVQKLNNGYLVEIKKQTSVTDIPAASVQPENSKTSSKIDEKNTIIHKKQKENEPQTRKCLIDNLSSTGVFCCSEVIDSETFVAYLFSDDCLDDLTLLEEIENDCVTNPSYRPRVGDLVAVEKKDEEGDKWVRGLIADIKNGEYSCALIDYGVTQISRIVKKLPEKYTNIPDFTCVCKTDPQSLKTIEAAKDGVVYTVASAGILKLQIDEQTITVTAQRWNPIKMPEQRTYKALPMPTLTDGDIVKVKMVDDDTFSLLCETKQCALRHKEIAAYMATITAEILSTPPEIDQLVLSPCEGEAGLFRGVVKSVKNELAEIYFIDYGNSDTVPIKTLKNIDGKLAGFEPALVQSPQYWYLREKKFSAECFNYLEENVMKKYTAVNCATKFDLKNSDGVLLSKILEDLKNGKAQAKGEQEEATNKSTNEKLNTSSGSTQTQFVSATPSNSSVNSVAKSVKTKFTYNDLTHTSLSPGLYQCICVFCEELVDGLATFILADETAILALNELQEKIDKYVQTETTPYNADEFDLCVAIFEECWYRGVVIEKKDQSRLIFFVDYGNTADVAVENIRKISEELVALPTIAMICQLDGVNEVSAALLAELQKHIIENQQYEVEIVSEKEQRHLIRIPVVYEKIKSYL